MVIVTFDDGEILDVTGPASVFAQANQLAGSPCYRIRIAAPAPRTVAGGGVVLETEPISGVRGPIDTLVVAGGTGTIGVLSDRDLVHHVQRLAGRARRVTSVCTGAFVLAEAGLLDGRRATTHWVAAGHLGRTYPRIDVDADLIHVRDGNVWTSAGVTAGLDLALALVADDHGQHLAHEVARWLVLPVRRTGGQSQYSPQLAATAPQAGELGAVLVWIADHLDDDLSLARLADRAGLSERHFGRRFKAETGATPAGYVEALRLDAARRLLEAASLSAGAIAREVGFGSRETLHRAFRRRLGTTPSAYRRSFVA